MLSLHTLLDCYLKQAWANKHQGYHKLTNINSYYIHTTQALLTFNISKYWHVLHIYVTCPLFTSNVLWRMVISFSFKSTLNLPKTNLDCKLSSKGEICPSSPKNEAFGKLSTLLLNILCYILPRLTHIVWCSFHASAACEKQQGSYFTKLLLRRKIRQRSTCTQCTYRRVPSEQNPVNKTQATKKT